MSSAYTRNPPSTGPGSFTSSVPDYSTFQALGIGTLPGLGYYSNLGTNNTPDPGAPAADVDGILLETSFSKFLALETSLGGPTSVLIKE